MPVFNESRNTVRQSVGRSSNKMLGRRTYSVTQASPAAVRAEDIVLRDANQGRGLYLYVPDGGGLGQARTVVSATAFVQGTGSILYPHLDFSPAPSTNANLELWADFDPTVVNGFIDDAVRNAAKQSLARKEDYSLQLGDPLRHWGSFERWPSGASAAPSGWTLAGDGAQTVARESTLVYSGRYSALVTNANAEEAYLESDNIKDFASFAGEVVTVKALVYTTTGARVNVRLLDGVSTFQSGNHDGTGGWHGNSGDAIIIDNVTVSNALTQLKVQCFTSTGGVVTAYWGKVWMEHNGQVYDFDLPSSISPAVGNETAFTYISEVWLESLITPGQYNDRVLPEFYRIDSDSSTHRIVFTKGLIDQYVTPARGVKIIGQRSARLPGADTDNLEVDPEYVRLHTMYSLLDSMPWDDMDRSKRDRFRTDAAAKLAEITTAVYPDSVALES